MDVLSYVFQNEDEFQAAQPVTLGKTKMSLTTCKLTFNQQQSQQSAVKSLPIWSNWHKQIFAPICLQICVHFWIFSDSGSEYLGPMAAVDRLC